MAGQLAGPGQGLPFPQSLYPVNLLNGELVSASNYQTLAPGQALPVPRGTWAIDVGGYAFVQYADPVTGTWRNFSSARKGLTVVVSDGFNYRVANLTGCAVSAVVTNGGSSYAQSTTTVTAASGNSTWQAIVGGRVSTTVSISNAGSGYGVTPLVFIPAPPNPGVPATAIAVMASGTISSITVINQGAGYQTAPAISIYPNPTDPSYLAGSAITTATAVATLTGASQVSAVLCTNNGAPLTSIPALTISSSGSGASAAATISQLTTLTSASITSGGAGFSANVELSTLGGQASGTATYTNPAIELTGYIPRKASALLTSAGGTIATVSTIYDGGLFLGTPTPLITTQTGAGGTTAATIVLTLGSTNATVLMQNLG
jgi:hypothetical protein